VLYHAARPVLTGALWVAAGTLAFFAVRWARANPCAPHNGGWLFIIGVGLTSALAMFGSLVTVGLVRRGVLAVLVSAAIGAAAGFAIYFALLSTWVSHCAN
jgi:uncharacterized transporter YbjL